MKKKYYESGYYLNYPKHRLLAGAKCRQEVMQLDGFIEFSGDRYQVIIREAGRVSLLRYNSKTRMWIQLNLMKMPMEAKPKGTY